MLLDTKGGPQCLHLHVGIGKRDAGARSARTALLLHTELNHDERLNDRQKCNACAGREKKEIVVTTIA